MSNRLFIIGNGFDLSHVLPTKFDPDFKKIAERNESIPYFWDLYQTQENDIWSDFENLLSTPDFASLSEIFEGFYPDYGSDRESDRDGIILQVALSGKLNQSLNEFANQADEAVKSAYPKKEFSELFDEQDFFINFNYTHTLEKLYQIDAAKILHVHGEVGQNMLLGYPEGKFSPGKIFYDVRGKDRGPYREMDYRDYLDIIDDYYVRTSHENLIQKAESFSKTPQIELVSDFLETQAIDEIYVKGHSVAIDYPYFDWLNDKFRSAEWYFDAFDKKTESNIENLAKEIKINNYQIN